MPNLSRVKDAKPKSIVVNSDAAIPSPTIALNGKKFSYRAAAGPSGPSVPEIDSGKYKPGKWDI